MKMRTLGLLASAVVGLVLGASAVRANSIEIAVGSPVVASDGSGGFNWTYTLTLTATDSITPNGAANSSFNNLVNNSNGSVVVFYEIGGFKGASAAPTVGSWTATGLAPLAPSTIGSDSGIYSPVHNGPGTNVVFVYTGSTFTAPTGPDTVLGTFTIDSTLGSGGNLDYGARYLTSLTPTSAENSDTPLGPSAVPVPAAAWMGLSTLGGLGVMSLLRKRR